MNDAPLLFSNFHIGREGTACVCVGGEGGRGRAREREPERVLYSYVQPHM